MEKSRIITAVRIRPLSNNEYDQKNKIVATIAREGQVILLHPCYYDTSQTIKDHKISRRIFQFDYSFDSLNKNESNKDGTQENIYLKIGISMIDTSMRGYNCSLFAYGQTGSGKTHTMVGVLEDHEEEGLIPRLSRDILIQSKLKKNTIDQLSGDLIIDVQLQVSFYEIYNERVFDLLSTNTQANTNTNITTNINTNTNTNINININTLHESNEPVPCRVRQHPDTGAFIEGLTFRSVDTYEAVLQSLFEGFQRRITGETLMNAKSSRSHAVFTITIIQTRETKSSSSSTTSTSTRNEGEVSRQTSPNSSPSSKRSQLTYIRSSKICLVDLAGSERLDSTKAKGVRMKEGTMINLSLSTLGDVIKALSQKSNTGNSPKHIPYRNSILTWLLKDCIGGNSCTTILATISPIASSYAESLNTIRFITKAKYIVNKVNINDKLNHYNNEQSFKLIEEMKHKLLNCEKRIFELQQVIEKNGLLSQVSEVNKNNLKLDINSQLNINDNDNININDNDNNESENENNIISMGSNESMQSIEMRIGIDDVIISEMAEEDDILTNSYDGSEENEEEIIEKFNQINDIQENHDKLNDCENHNDLLITPNISNSHSELDDEHLPSEITEFTIDDLISANLKVAELMTSLERTENENKLLRKRIISLEQMIQHIATE